MRPETVELMDGKSVGNTYGSDMGGKSKNNGSDLIAGQNEKKDTQFGDNSTPRSGDLIEMGQMSKE